MKKILIDAGHGFDTPGKRSPDGKFREYAFNRIIAQAIVKHLVFRGYDAELLVPEDDDVPLILRCARVFKHTYTLGKDNVILVSVHVNAAGNGKQWMGAQGWSCYTSVGETQADRLATCLAEAALKNLPGQKLRFDFSDGDADQEARFYILNGTQCPAVLTENLFMDNREDLAFLSSPEGQKAIVTLHVEGIVNYLAEVE